MSIGVDPRRERGLDMKALIKVGFWGLLVSYVIACSPVKFSKDAGSASNCDQVNAQSTECVNINSVDHFNKTITISGGRVDILIVNDNSGSMSAEQNNMAQRFQSFLQGLQNRAIDYQIAVTTTDITQGGGSALSHGGRSFITSAMSTSDQQAWFDAIIRRQETLTCENFLSTHRLNTWNTWPQAGFNSYNEYYQAYKSNCPSDDERGIAAASKFVNANPEGFFREDSNIAIVFLSDEDVRGGAYYSSASYKLSGEDLPQNLVSLVKSKFPGKSFSAHSIIVRPGDLAGNYNASVIADGVSLVINQYNQIDSSRLPNLFYRNSDSTCLATQSAQVNAGYVNSVRGSYGYQYDLLSKMTGGIVGNICANDYGSQLYSMGTQISDQSNEFDLGCENPTDLTVAPADIPFQVTGSTFKLTQDLTPGTSLEVSWSCKTN